MVQGALRYAYKVALLQGGDKEKAEGAAFSGAILPRIAACSTKDAATIQTNVFIDGTISGAGGYAAVKSAFENNYACMGITCAQVGGLVDGNFAYYTGASPCIDAKASGCDDSDKTGFFALLVLFLLLVVAVLALGVCFYLKCYCFKTTGSETNESSAENPVTAHQQTPVAAAAHHQSPVATGVLVGTAVNDPHHKGDIEAAQGEQHA